MLDSLINIILNYFMSELGNVSILLLSSLTVNSTIESVGKFCLAEFCHSVRQRRTGIVDRVEFALCGITATIAAIAASTQPELPFQSR